MTARPRCDHGYVMTQDSSPMCDHMEEKPHAATTVRVTPSWSNSPHVRCTARQRPASRRIHTRQEQP